MADLAARKRVIRHAAQIMRGDRMTERCPACGDESASPPAEVFCVRCATEDYAITEQRLKVARLEDQREFGARDGVSPSANQPQTSEGTE